MKSLLTLTIVALLLAFHPLATSAQSAPHEDLVAASATDDGFVGTYTRDINGKTATLDVTVVYAWSPTTGLFLAVHNFTVSLDGKVIDREGGSALQVEDSCFLGVNNAGTGVKFTLTDTGVQSEVTSGPNMGNVSDWTKTP